MTFKDIIYNYDLSIKKYQSNNIILNENYKTLNEKYKVLNDNYKKICNEYDKLKSKLNKNKIVDLSKFINKSINKYTYINNELSIKLFINDNIFILQYDINKIYNIIKNIDKFNKYIFDYTNDLINYKYDLFYRYLIRINKKNKSFLQYIVRTSSKYDNNLISIEFIIDECFIKENNEIYQDILYKFEKIINYSIKKLKMIL